MSVPSFSEELNCNELEQKLSVSEMGFCSNLWGFFYSICGLFHCRVAKLYQKSYVQQIPGLDKLCCFFPIQNLCVNLRQIICFKLLLLYEILLRYILYLKVLPIQWQFIQIFQSK